MDDGFATTVTCDGDTTLIAVTGEIDIAADVALIGNEARVGEQLAALADAGVTDFAAAVYGTPEERDRTMALLSTVRRPG